LDAWIVTVFLGDSLTAGFQQGPGSLPLRYYPLTNMLESSLRMWLGEIDAERDIVIVNQGCDGDSTVGMLNRFDVCVKSEDPDIVLIWGGINDLSSMMPPGDIYRNIVKLVEKTRAIRAFPVVLNVAPVGGVHFNDQVRALNHCLMEYCRSCGVTCLDVFSLLVDGEGKLAEEYSNDGVHLSDKGYRTIMQSIYSKLVEIIQGLITN
jgi:acyl-CoA thioesterase I